MEMVVRRSSAEAAAIGLDQQASIIVSNRGYMQHQKAEYVYVGHQMQGRASKDRRGRAGYGSQLRR